jgi:hypothetical protein
MFPALPPPTAAAPRPIDVSHLPPLRKPVDSAAESAAAARAAAVAAAAAAERAKAERAAQLARAFGVGEQHVSRFANLVAYRAELIEWAREERELVREVEARFERLLRSETRRVAFAVMPKRKRAIIHEMAQVLRQYLRRPRG